VAFVGVSESSPLCERLLPSAVPSRFAWSSTPTACQQQRRARAGRRAVKLEKTTSEVAGTITEEIPCIGAEVAVHCDSVVDQKAVSQCMRETEFSHSGTQTDSLVDGFSVHKFENDPKG